MANFWWFSERPQSRCGIVLICLSNYQDPAFCLHCLGSRYSIFMHPVSYTPATNSAILLPFGRISSSPLHIASTNCRRGHPKYGRWTRARSVLPHLRRSREATTRGLELEIGRREDRWREREPMRHVRWTAETRACCVGRHRWEGEGWHATAARC